MAWWNKKRDDEKEESTAPSSSNRVVEAVKNLYQRVVDNQRRAVEADQAVARETARQVTSAPKAVFNALDRATQSTTQANMAAQRAQTQRVQDAARNIYGAYQQQQERAARDQMAEQARQRQAQQQRMQQATQALYRQSQIQQQANRNQAETMAGLYTSAANSLRGANELYQRQLAGTDTGNRANELMTQPVLQRANQRQSSLESGDPNTGAGKYFKYLTAADFRENSLAREDNKDATYNYINNLNGERERQQGYAMQRGADSGLEKYQLMTDSERGVYNYLYNTQGKTSAEGFLARIEPELNEQYYSGQSAWMSEQANQDKASRIGFTAATVAQQPVRTLSGAAAIAEDAIRTATGQGIDPNSELRRASALAQDVRGAIAQHYDEQYPNGILGMSGGEIYQTICSALDSTMNAAFSYAGGQMLSALRGVNDIKKIEAFTNKLGSALMSSEVAASAVAESKQKGYSDVGAVSLGLVRGYIEYMSEKLGGEWAISWMRKSPLNPAKVILQTMIPEGVEELMSDFGNETVNLILDNLLGTDESYIKQAYDYFKENGSENPWKDTLKTIWSQEIKSFVSGSLAALGTGTSIYIQNRGIINEAATRLHTDGEGIVKVMEDMDTDNPSAVDRLARLTGADSVEALKERYEQVAEAFGAKSLDDLNDMIEQAAEDGENIDERMRALAQGQDPEAVETAQPETVRETAPGNEGLRSEFAARVATEEGVPVPLEGITPERQTVVEQAAQDIRNAAQQGMAPPIEQYNAPAQTQQRTPGLTLATEAGRLGDVEYDAVDYNTLNDTQRSIVDATGRMAEALGLDVTVINAAGNVGGAYQKGGKIYLNIASGMDLQGFSKAIAESSFAHELGHWMKDAAKNDAQAAADYQALQDMVLGTMSEDQLESLIQEKMAAEPNLTREGAIEEVVSDAIQPLLQDSKAFEQMARENPSLAQRILDFLKQFLDRIRDAFGEVDYSDNLPIYHAVQAIEDSLGEMQETYDRALLSARDYQQRRNEAERKQNIKDADARVSSDVEQNLQTVDSTAVDGVVVSNDLATLMRNDGFSKPVDAMDEMDTQYQVWTTDDWASTHLKRGGDPEVANQVLAFTGRMIGNEAIMGYVPAGHYAKSKMGPLRKNIEYRWTFDLDASCPRTFQFVNYRNALQKIAGRPLTDAESFNLMYLMKRLNQQIPCTYCYVENKRIMKNQSYLNWFQSRSDVMNAATDEEARTRMYGYDEKKNTLGTAAQKVFDEWRSAANNGEAFAPTAEECWTAYQTAKNSAFNWLDQKLEDGGIRFGEGVKKATSAKQMSNMLCREFNITDKAARREVESFVSQWRYDTLAGNKHVYDIPNNTDVSEINQDMLTLHRAATNYASSVSQARLVDDYLPYTDQVKNISDEDLQYIMGMGGIRKHSSNDFRWDYVHDYILFYADLAREKLTGHTYTKSTDFCRMFGRTGDRINLSIAFNTENGKVVENQQEGAPHREAQQLRDAYNTVGVMAMVTDNAQLSYALNNDWIDMCIPFHASGLPKSVWYNVKAWFDYTSTQLESYYNSTEMKQRLNDAGVNTDGLTAEQVEDLYNSTFDVPVIRNAQGKRVKPHFYPNDYTIKGPNGETQTIPGHHNDAGRYMELCEQYGVHPRFYGIKVTDANGNVIDVTEHPNYLKLIKETARTDTEQQPIQFNFAEYDKNLGMSPLDYAMQKMEEEAKNGGYANTAQDPMGIVDMFRQLYLGQNREVGWMPDETDESDVAEHLRAAIEYTANANNQIYDADMQVLADYQKEAQQGGSTPQFQRWDGGQQFNSREEIDAEIERIQDQIRDIQEAQRQALDEAKADPRVQEKQKAWWDAEDRGENAFTYKVEYRRTLNQVKAELNAQIPEGDLNELAQRIQDLRKEREDFISVTPITNEQYDQLADHFGVTDDFDVAGFILTDGRMLDFSGKKQYGKNYAGGREVYHNEVGDVLDLPTDTSPRINMVSNGNIRLVPEINGINLSQKPTMEQRRILREYINHHNGDVHVDIDNRAGRTLETLGYRAGTPSTRILSDIDSYFDTGEVTQRPAFEQFLFQRWDDQTSREDDQLANELTSTTEAAPEEEAPSEPAPSEPAPAYNDGTMGLFGPTNEEQEAKAAEQAGKTANEALNKYIEDLPDDPMDLYTKQQKVTAEKKGEERITTRKGKKDKTLRQKVSEGWHGFIRLMANDGDAIHQAGRQTGNKALDGMFFYAKAARQRAQDWIQGKRMSFGLDKTGDSLNSIFDPIRAKGDEYYKDFQLYLYHMLNVERMSRSTGDEVPALKDTLKQLRQKANRHGIDLGSMTDDELQRRAQAYKEGGAGGLYDEIGDLASQYWETKKDLMRAERQQNKPVFGWDEDSPDADASKKIAEDLLAAHPEFEQEAQKVYDYIDDLLQYRVDAGLITQADMDNLKSIYPHYVPVLYDYEDAPQEIRKGGLTVSSTIKSAQGGDTTLLPLHYALARQTLSVMRNAGFQQLGGTVLGEYENSGELMGKWVQDVKESEAAWDPSMADNEVPQTRENVVTVFKDGKRYDMTLSPDMAYAFNSLQPSGEENILGAMVGGTNDLFKKLCTAYNPLFMLTNPVRDVQDALFYSTDTKRWVKNYPKAWRQIAGNGKFWQMYKAMGGVYNSYFDWATGDSDGKKMGKVEMANLWIEQAPRLAEFMTVLENAERDHGSVTQEDRMEAFNAAAEITTNFSRSGKVGRFINRYVVPFWNPGVQGLSKVTRTLTETRGFKSWAGLALKAAALGIVPQILNGLLYRDDDEWDVIDDDMKANYYLFKGKDGVWIKIPKGRVLAALSTPVVGLMESARGDEVDWGALGTAAVSSVAPNNPLESTLLSTAMRADLFDPDSPGKTWYGGDIESKRLQGYAPGERYDESTDAISKWLGGKLDLSPKKLNYILDQYSGVLGDLVLPYLTPKAERGVYVGDYAIPLSNAFMSRFTTDTVTSNTIGNEYYGLLDQLTWKANAGDDAAAMAKKYMNRAGGTVSDYYAQIRKIENDPNLSDKEKTTLTRELRKQLNAYEQQVTADAQAYLETAQEYIDAHPEADYTDDAAVDAYVEGFNSTQTDEKNMITADDAARKMQDEVYREANRRHFGSEYALQVYNKDVFAKAQQANEDAGVSYDDYYDYYFGTKNLKSDKDENGKTISGSKKEKVVAYIDGMDIPDEQKDALYLASGYTENTLEDAPWNGGTGKYTGSSGSGSGRKKTPETRLKEYQDVQTKKAADPNYNPATDGHAWTIWADRAVESGIKIEDTIKHMTELGKFTADYDQYGKAIVGSKKDKVCAYIDALDLTKAQKDLLYLYIYGENSLRFTPWHGWTGDRKRTGRRSRRRGGRRRSGGSTSRSVKQVGMLAKGYSTDGIDVSALFGVSGSGRSQTQNASAASDLLEIINKHYGGSALAAAMDGGKRAKGRTTLDFKL